MTNYSKPVWKMIKEVLEDSEEAYPLEVIRQIRLKYPNDKVNERTIRAQLIATSVNHTSAHYYPNTQRFLFLLPGGKYRLYNPETDGQWVVDPTGPRRVDEEMPPAEIPYAKMDPEGRVALPPKIRTKLNIAPNDIVAFIEDGGKIVMKKAKIRLDLE